MTSLKCVVVGDGAVGKSCLLIRYTNRFFPGEYMPSVSDFYAATVKVEGQTVSLTLFDTAGQGEYERMRLLNYPDTDIALVCFSLISPVSLDHARTKWGPEILQHCPRGTPLLLVGTKKDIRDSRTARDDLRDQGKVRSITYPEGLVAAKELGAAAYIECSALNQESVNRVFEEAIKTTLLSRSKARRKSHSCTIQ